MKISDLNDFTVASTPTLKVSDLQNPTVVSSPSQTLQQPTPETYGALFPASSTDTPIQASVKSAGNTVSSGVNLVEGITSALAHPIKTLKGVTSVVKGSGEALGRKILESVGLKGNADAVVPSESEQSFNSLANSLKERFGSLENLQRTATNDPLGFGTDIVSVLAGGAGLAGKTAEFNSSLNKVGKIAASPITAPLQKVGEVVQSITPKLLSYTSDVPEQAFKTLLERREPVTEAIGSGVGAEAALDTTRQAVRGLRKDLSNDWDVGTQKVIQENTGVRVGLSDKLINKLETVSDEFGIDIPPGTNLGNLSANETIGLLKKINSLPEAMLTFSPKGAVVRELKGELKNLAIKSFGGEKGEFANLYKNYSAKKSVLDAANDIVNAYKEGRPIKDTTAMNRLQNIFDENKPAYLEAIMDLEKSTGKDILSQVAASKFKPIVPSSMNKLSAAGGLATKKGLLDKLISIVAFPLTSPRSAAFITRNLKIPKMISSPISPIVIPATSSVSK